MIRVKKQWVSEANSLFFLSLDTINQSGDKIEYKNQ